MAEMTEQERLILDLTVALKDRITANIQFNQHAQELVDRGYAMVQPKMPTLSEIQAMWRASDACVCGHRRDAHDEATGWCCDVHLDDGEVNPCACTGFNLPVEQCYAENWDGEYCVLDRGHAGPHSAEKPDV